METGGRARAVWEGGRTVLGLLLGTDDSSPSTRCSEGSLGRTTFPMLHLLLEKADPRPKFQRDFERLHSIPACCDWLRDEGVAQVAQSE